MTKAVLQQLGVSEAGSTERSVKGSDPHGPLHCRWKETSSRGFSLIEVVVVLLVFSVLTAVATSLLVESHKSLQNRLSSSSLSDTGLIGLSQMAREIRMAGYPSAKSFSQSAVSSRPGIVAIPFVSVSTYDLVFEADTDGDGLVERIEYVLSPGSTKLARNLTVKNPDGTLATLTASSSTILDNVQNQLQGQSLFTWDVDPSSTRPFPQNIRTVYINTILKTSGGESGAPVNTTMTATCQRLNP